MKISGWGNYPIFDTNICYPKNIKEIINHINSGTLIARGNGRSYGDSSINVNKTLSTKYLNKILKFDKKSGIITAEAGVLLKDIIELCVPNGWFLKTTPGTKYVTLGGAISSDVHGKNHHLEGCFSNCVSRLTIINSNQDIIECSQNLNQDLFKATCGGMGLTGIILEAEISLKKVNSKFLNQTTIKTKNLKDTFKTFETYSNKPNSVAWIDCLAKNDQRGKGVFMFGEFKNDGDLKFKEKKKINIPFSIPSFFLNRFFLKLFNFFYYKKAPNSKTIKKVDLDTFFYPLDNIKNWNKFYGDEGFVQYQFIIPEDVSLRGIDEILNLISDSGRAPFLGVLKFFGDSNENYLSFPMKGYSLAVDFKYDESLLKFLDEIDKIVLKFNGRIYLTKDARLSKRAFDTGYPLANKFREFRKKHGLDKKFQSSQSNRLEI